MVIIPESIIAGDSYELVGAFDDYPATTWTAELVFAQGSKRARFSATASGNSFSFEIDSASSLELAVGRSAYQIQVSDNLGTNKTVQSGQVEICPSLFSDGDFRSHAERMLEAIEAVLENKATSDQKQLTIKGRSIVRFDPDQLEAWRDRYRREVALERRKAQGKTKTVQQIKARF